MPGRYKTRVPEDSYCYRERLKDNGGGSDSIIAGYVDSGARGSVTVKRGEFFTSEDCGTWTRSERLEREQNEPRGQPAWKFLRESASRATACPEFLHGIPPETPRLAEQSSDPNTCEARRHAHARGSSVFSSCGVRKCVGLWGVQHGGDVHTGVG
jgi:hypothetical protein